MNYAKYNSPCMLCTKSHSCMSDNLWGKANIVYLFHSIPKDMMIDIGFNRGSIRCNIRYMFVEWSDILNKGISRLCTG